MPCTLEVNSNGRIKRGESCFSPTKRIISPLVLNIIAAPQGGFIVPHV